MNKLEYRRLESYLEKRLIGDQIIRTSWYAISGAPCSGKTTIINELKKRGFSTNPDIARLYIENEMKNGTSKNQVRADRKRFRRIIFLKMFENLSTLPITLPIFHDYALPDNIAFYKIDGIDLSPDLCRSARMYEYAKVFFFDPLPYLQDDIRIENERLQIMLDKKMREVYRNLGYELIQIPVMPVLDRVNKILSYI